MSRTERDPRLIHLAEQVGKLLRLKGPCTLQGMRDREGKFLFTDINLRFGGGVLHSIQMGIDLPRYIYQDLRDGMIDEAQTGDYRKPAIPLHPEETFA